MYTELKHRARPLQETYHALRNKETIQKQKNKSNKTKEMNEKVPIYAAKAYILYTTTETSVSVLMRFSYPTSQS